VSMTNFIPSSALKALTVKVGMKETRPASEVWSATACNQKIEQGESSHRSRMKFDACNQIYIRPTCPKTADIGGPPDCPA
jgi:hypothetical protein